MPDAAPGQALTLHDIHHRYLDAYNELTPVEKTAITEEFKASKETALRRSTPRGCVQDIVNVSRNMQLLV